MALCIRSGGEGGIRTLGRLTPTPDFESGTFDHSATSPRRGGILAHGEINYQIFLFVNG